MRCFGPPSPWLDDCRPRHDVTDSLGLQTRRFAQGRPSRRPFVISERPQSEGALNGIPACRVTTLYNTGEKMKKAKAVSAIIVSLLTLCGCGNQKATCSSPDGADVLSKMIKDAAESKLSNIKNSDGSQAFDSSTIRSIINKITISIEDVRTSKDEANSTKVSCEANLKIAIPSQVLDDAQSARSEANLGTIQTLTASNSLKQDSGGFTKPIEYNLQKTDDGKKIYAETADHKSAAEFITEIAGSAMMKPLIEAKKVELTKKEEEAAKAAEEQQKKIEEEATIAALAQAKHDNSMANQTIDELWKSIPEDERKMMLSEQRAWIKKKESDCSQLAAKESKQADRDITKLNCDTTSTQVRIADLQKSRN